MMIDYKTARLLCTPVEFSLLQEVMPKKLTQLSTPELKSALQRVRRYSVKWGTLARQQGHSTDGSGDRSMRKHEWFREALNRVEARIARVEAAAAKSAATSGLNRVKARKAAIAKKAAKTAAKKTVAKKAAVAVPKPPKKTAVKAASKAAARRGSPMPKEVRAKEKAITNQLRIEKSGISSRIRGHVSAQGRRNQAARSSRKRS